MGIPTATEKSLGHRRVTLGPSVILVYLQKGFVGGVAVSNDFSVTSESGKANINKITLSPFLAYSLGDGWSATTAPTITADWEAEEGQRWSIPVGGGFSKSWRGSDGAAQSAGAELYHFVEAQGLTADWQLKVQYKTNF